MYFHLSIPGHPVGTVVEPGRWGSIVLGSKTHTWLEAETLLEIARQQLAPAAPSRLYCAYLCEDMAAAREFQRLRPGDAIYEAELVDPATLVHRANVRLIHPAMGRMLGWDWRVQAKGYWVPSIHAPQPGYEFVPELLVDGAIRLGAVAAGPLSAGS